MHDIAHGESDATLDTARLLSAFQRSLGCIARPSRAWQRRQSLRGSSAPAFLLLLFDLGVISTKLHPKYGPDPMLASLFLTVGLPALGLTGYHLARETFRRRTGPGA